MDTWRPNSWRKDAFTPSIRQSCGRLRLRLRRHPLLLLLLLRLVLPEPGRQSPPSDLQGRNRLLLDVLCSSFRATPRTPYLPQRLEGSRELAIERGPSGEGTRRQFVGTKKRIRRATKSRSLSARPFAALRPTIDRLPFPRLFNFIHFYQAVHFEASHAARRAFTAFHGDRISHQERQQEFFNQGATELRTIGVRRHELACDIVRVVEGEPC